MTQKPPTQPRWYKNTYFWIAAILFLIGVAGLPFFGGDTLIRDPGQRPETVFPLWLLYLAASGIMLLNGYLSHKQTVQHYNELIGGKEE